MVIVENRQTRRLAKLTAWMKISKEVKRYINEDSDSFSVSIGGFDVKFDGDEKKVDEKK